MKYTPYYLEDVYKAASQEKFTFISTFAGGGGSSTGYKLAGGKCLGINEFVEEATNSYLQNYPNTPHLDGDIRNYTAKDFLELGNIKVKELDIYDHSPPCSNFSVAGKGKKNWDKEKKYSDGKKVKNIENLFLDSIEIANGLQPKIIVGENVVGLSQGNNREKLNEFIQVLDSIGYTTAYDIVNAAEFGAPQTRQRTIFISIRNDIADVLGINNFNILEVFPEPKYSQKDFISIKNAIHDVENDKEEEKELEEYCKKSFQYQWISQLPFNPTRTTKASEIHPNHSLFNMIRPCPDLACPTLTQQGQQKSVSGVFHYEKNRKLTIKEMMRIMALPDDYYLTGDFNKRAERIGRMHCPVAVKAIAESVYEKVLQPFKRIENPYD